MLSNWLQFILMNELKFKMTEMSYPASAGWNSNDLKKTEYINFKHFSPAVSGTLIAVEPAAL